jgi:hypothetical protein
MQKPRLSARLRICLASATSSLLLLVFLRLIALLLATLARLLLLLLAALLSAALLLTALLATLLLLLLILILILAHHDLQKWKRPDGRLARQREATLLCSSRGADGTSITAEFYAHVMQGRTEDGR